MSKYPCYNFILSHSNGTGFDYVGKINEIINNYDVANRAIAFIQSITSYSAYTRFAESESKLNSMFSFGGYVFIVRSYPKSDSRLFIEKDVTIIDTNVEENGFFDIESQLGKQVCIFDSMVHSDIEYNFNLSLLMTIYNTRLKNYILIRDYDDFSQKLFFTICKAIPTSLLKDLKIIETFSEFTDVDANIYICRCIDDSDYEKFNRIIKAKVDSCVVDFYNLEKFYLNFNINNPTFSNYVIAKLVDKFDQYSDLLKYLDYIAESYRFLSKENFQTYLDAITFLAFYKKDSTAMNHLIIESKDFNTLKKFFISMEGDKNGK